MVALQWRIDGKMVHAKLGVVADFAVFFEVVMQRVGLAEGCVINQPLRDFNG